MSNAPLPNDYLERVYAGVLGKLIGVYVGRPFEGWTYQKIMSELGEVDYYVHDRLGVPLVVTDDDVAGTFTFVRALEDYGISPDLSAEDIGRAWLNYLVEQRTVLWWGGNGNSTEHTAWLNLKRGLPAPASGSIATNGATVAEQIGAQIFIDGWAMVAPGQPALAAKLARQAGLVSHDGESVHAAVLWAAMEAEAFVSNDIDHLIETGLAAIPKDCLIARLIGDIRAWHREFRDWRDTRQKIEDHYGYDKFPGNCHVVPNHALMIMAILYAPDDFQRAQMIVNTSGWDTDCNAGNVGCLLGIKLGLEGIDAGTDWRGPVADRLLISSADGGNAINDAVRTSYRLAALGHQLAGNTAPVAPKGGAQFHFSLPGSVQGFRAEHGHGYVERLDVENRVVPGGRALAIAYRGLGPGQIAAATTPVFTPPEVLNMRTYELMATPLVYPGQRLEAALAAESGNHGAVTAGFRLKVYGADDALKTVDGPVIHLAPGSEGRLDWVLPDCGGQPIAEIGFVIRSEGPRADGAVLVDHVRYGGTPDLHLRRPDEPSDFWRMAWVNGASFFSKRFPQSFRLSQDRGEGIIIHGTREWTDYKVAADTMIHLGNEAGVAVRVQGLRRYYAALLSRDGMLRIVRQRDETRTVLAETPFTWSLETLYDMAVEADGTTVRCRIGGTELVANDDSAEAFHDGGIGLIVHEGALSSNAVRVSALA